MFYITRRLKNKQYEHKNSWSTWTVRSVIRYDSKISRKNNAQIYHRDRYVPLIILNERSKFNVCVLRCYNFLTIADERSLFYLRQTPFLLYKRTPFSSGQINVGSKAVTQVSQRLRNYLVLNIVLAAFARCHIVAGLKFNCSFWTGRR